MSQFPFPDQPASGQMQTSFTQRYPSQTWERIPFAEAPQSFVWVWYKPPNVPQGLVVRISDEAWQADPQTKQLTLRIILTLAGVDPMSVAMWQLGGMAFPGMSGANPLLDQPIPFPAPGTDPIIAIYVNVPQVNFVPQSFMPTMNVPSANPASVAPSQDLSDLFDRLDAEWTAALDVEKDLERLRKLLVDLTGRLKILNRNLSSDERLYSSREDKTDWQDARRFLRDADNRLRAYIKEFDIGDPSSAGHRRWFAQIYQQFIVPRLPFDGMEQSLNDFDFYRKLLITLQGKMNNAYLTGQSNGERRAQMVLARIANKVREASNKKTALGVVLDG